MRGCNLGPGLHVFPEAAIKGSVEVGAVSTHMLFGIQGSQQPYPFPPCGSCQRRGELASSRSQGGPGGAREAQEELGGATRTEEDTGGPGTQESRL
jgi:hypothetical protein